MTSGGLARTSSSRSAAVAATSTRWRRARKAWRTCSGIRAGSSSMSNKWAMVGVLLVRQGWPHGEVRGHAATGRVGLAELKPLVQGQLAAKNVQLGHAASLIDPAPTDTGWQSLAHLHPT